MVKLRNKKVLKATEKVNKAKPRDPKLRNESRPKSSPKVKNVESTPNSEIILKKCVVRLKRYNMSDIVAKAPDERKMSPNKKKQIDTHESNTMKVNDHNTRSKGKKATELPKVDDAPSVHLGQVKNQNTQTDPKIVENSSPQGPSSAGAGLHLKKCVVKVKRLKIMDDPADDAQNSVKKQGKTVKEHSKDPVQTTTTTTSKHEMSDKFNQTTNEIPRRVLYKSKLSLTKTIIENPETRLYAEINKEIDNHQYRNKSDNLPNESKSIEELSEKDDQEVEPLSVLPEMSTEKRRPIRRFRQKSPEALNKKVLTMKKAQSNKKTPSTSEKNSSGNIYDFPSQSQTSDGDVDPAADIIQKLITEGKVAVATNRKGTGRPKIKRLRKPKNDEANRPPERKTGFRDKKEKHQTVAKNGFQLCEEINPLLSPDDENLNIQPIEPESPPDVIVPDWDLPEILPPVKTYTKPSHNDSHVEGSFSNLARSVLINEAGKNNYNYEKVRDPRKLLEMARKCISTPLNKKVTPPNSLDYSPIAAPMRTEQEQKGSLSPWRVNEETHLPSVFYFSRDSCNLPSISSDFIPATPRKVRKRNASSPPMPHNDSLLPMGDLSSGNSKPAATNSLSSFSSNDSNAENMPPPRKHNAADENANIFNKRQLPNPLQSMPNRSPLKAINILEVVALPPWKPTKRMDERIDKPENNGKPDNNKTDMFGFDEFLCDDQNYNNNNESAANPNYRDQAEGNCTLHEKLQALKKWRPSRYKPQAQLSSTPIAAVFGEERSKQRDIKEMFCSTMIRPPQSNVLTNRVMNESDGDDEQPSTSRQMRESMEKLEENLFNDPEPETSFNGKTVLRTYARPEKKKRKKRHNFVMFMDSDESDEVESDGEDAKKNRKVVNKKKRSRKDDIKLREELDSFVSEFNDMCKEVEQYDIPIERSNIEEETEE